MAPPFFSTGHVCLSLTFCANNNSINNIERSAISREKNVYNFTFKRKQTESKAHALGLIP